jgi:hypothetical protein
LQVSDGHTKVNAVEIEHIPELKTNLRPGSKILYKGGMVIHGKLLLTQNNVKFLGGEVQQLVEAWQANLNVQKFRLMKLSSKNKLSSSIFLIAYFVVDDLTPVTYKNKFSGKQDIGLIAHELQEVYPCLVNGVKDGEEHQSVNYTGLIGVLINEIKEIKERLKKIEEKNK